jgi:hypothetical protein
MEADMSDDRDQRIRRRAHEIWEREGRPHGKDAEHWERAVREIDGEAATLQPGGEAPARGTAKTRSRGREQQGGSLPVSGTGAGSASADGKGRSKPGKSAANPKRTGG